MLDLLKLVWTTVFTLNKDHANKIAWEPFASEAFYAGKVEYAFSAFYWLYCQGDIVASTPLLRDPEFLIKLDDLIGKDWNKMNRGTIWEFAGVQRHAYFNGSLRPVVDISLNDLRQAIRSN